MIRELVSKDSGGEATTLGRELAIEEPGATGLREDDACSGVRPDRAGTFAAWMVETLGLNKKSSTCPAPSVPRTWGGVSLLNLRV